jgi:inorganic pyrophosphatase
VAQVRFAVFIENEAGSTLKNHHDERALTFLRSEKVSRAYPFPYGFIIGTTNADGDCLDCFVIAKRALRTGEVVECEVHRVQPRGDGDEGDRGEDIIGARSNGLAAIAVTWGYGDVAELEAAFPDAIARSPAELKGHLSGERGTGLTP